jgi:DNA ligase-associated metallophosphoesterase
MIGLHASVHIREQELFLLPERAIYWPAEKTMLIADLHIGKVNHFRKNGIAVPDMAEQNNLWRLSGLLQKWKPKTLIFLGDLFHSQFNSAWDRFADVMGNFEHIEVILVKGNHDILPEQTFKNAGIAVVSNLIKGPFHFSHDRIESEMFNLHGHVHPAVKLRSAGRQRLRLPCFYFSDDFGILPSFGDFTGSFVISPKETDLVFVPSNDEVIALQG